MITAYELNMVTNDYVFIFPELYGLGFGTILFTKLTFLFTLILLKAVHRSGSMQLAPMARIWLHKIHFKTHLWLIKHNSTLEYNQKIMYI
jgi:hypothetical protein